MAKLLPCPFCGSRVRLHGGELDDGVNVSYVWCDDPECIAHRLWSPYATGEEAMAAWNRRDERTCCNLQREHWGEDYDDDLGFECSECGYDEPGLGEPGYCPSCGRKVMRDE